MQRPVAPTAKTAVRLRYYGAQMPYLVAIGVSFISAPAAVGIIALVALYFVVERAEPQEQRADVDGRQGGNP